MTPVLAALGFVGLADRVVEVGASTRKPLALNEVLVRGLDGDREVA
jgi:hypothetical protein